MEIPEFRFPRKWYENDGPLPPAQPGAIWVIGVGEWEDTIYYEEVFTSRSKETASDIAYDKFCKEMWEKYPAKRNHFPGWELNCLKEQTPEFCLAAVKRDWLAIRFVKNKTPDVCIAAIKQDAHAITFVEDPHPELVKFADNVRKYRLAGYVL